VDPAVFRRAASRSVSLPISYRSWPCAHPRGPRPLLGPRLRPDQRLSNRLRVQLPWGSRPFGAPSSRSLLPGDGFPAAACAAAFGRPLVAGFHTRFVPPSPFFAALTVCSSSNPVTYFSHSHPGVGFPCSPLDCLSGLTRGPGRPDTGDGMLGARGYPVDPVHWSAEAFRCARAVASVAETTAPTPAPLGLPTFRRPPAGLRQPSFSDLTVPGCPVPVRRCGKPPRPERPVPRRGCLSCSSPTANPVLPVSVAGFRRERPLAGPLALPIPPPHDG
jgi:hypothetical protein